MPSNSREPDMTFQPSPQQSKKPSMESIKEPPGSTTRSAVHRRKSSMNLQKTQSIAIKSDPKPSRSQGESSAKRKEQNRIAQRAFRKRQKAHLEELEAEVIEKGTRIREITENNGLLLETMKQLQNQNVGLKSSRAPNMSGFSQLHLDPTGTPLTSDRSVSHDLPQPQHSSRNSPRSRSENGWSSSTDSHGSNMSSPEATSPQTLPSTSLGSDLHIGSLTGLQLSFTPPTVLGHQLPRGGSSSHQGPVSGVSPGPGQVYRHHANTQQWTTANNSQKSNSSGNNEIRHVAAGNQMSLPSRTQNGPGPMARRYSDAITRRHHKHSMSDSQHPNGVAHRPHTSISMGHSNQKSPYHRHSNSVPNSAMLMTDGSPQMMFTRAFEPSFAQPTTFPGTYTPEQILHGQQHVMYQQPAAYSSSSSSNVGWSFSPLSQSASFTSVDPSGDYSRSSASYLSTLSLQPSIQSATDTDNFQNQLEAQAIAPGPLSHTWAAMMPSMGSATPLQELPGGGPVHIVGATSAAVDLQNHSTSNTDSPYLLETGVFNMNSMDMGTELSFSPFHAAQFFGSPSE